MIIALVCLLVHLTAAIDSEAFGLGHRKSLRTHTNCGVTKHPKCRDNA